MTSYLITGNPSTTVVSIDGCLDFRTTSDFVATCQTLLHEHRPLIVLITDEGRLDYAGLKALKQLHDYASGIDEASIVVAAVGEYARSTIALMGLDETIPVHSDLDEAWKSVQRQQDNIC